MTLTRTEILGAKDLPTEQVEVPEWGGTVTVRGLTAAERDAYEVTLVDFNNRGNDLKVRWSNARANLIARTVVDDAGERVFSDADVEALGRKSAKAVQRVFDVAARLSALSREDVEELVDSFTDAQGDDSSSELP